VGATGQDEAIEKIGKVTEEWGEKDAASGRVMSGARKKSRKIF